jgi:transcriptional regulator with XRE-family HTH domain
VTGHKKFSEVRAARSRSPGYEQRVAEIRKAMDTALALSAVRQARGFTQSQIASRMGKTQGNISRIEHGEDLYLSTLRDFVRGLGGRLEVNAVFDDQTISLLDAAEASGREESPSEVLQ